MAKGIKSTLQELKADKVKKEQAFLKAARLYRKAKFKEEETRAKEITRNSDQRLTKLWSDYFNHNYAWDDFQNHGGGNPEPHKRACGKIFDAVTKLYSAKLAKAMVKWAEDAYEWVFYTRGKTTEALIETLLKYKVDPTGIPEFYGRTFGDDDDDD